MPPSTASLAAAAALLLSGAAAFPAYVPLNPNAQAIPGVAAIGHVAPAGGGANNKFGTAFAANAHVRRRSRERSGEAQRSEGELSAAASAAAQRASAAERANSMVRDDNASLTAARAPLRSAPRRSGT